MNHKSFKNNYIQNYIEPDEYRLSSRVAQWKYYRVNFPMVFLFASWQIYLEGQILGLLFESQSNLSQPQSRLVSNYLWFNGIELTGKPIPKTSSNNALNNFLISKDYLWSHTAFLKYLIFPG